MVCLEKGDGRSWAAERRVLIYSLLRSTMSLRRHGRCRSRTGCRPRKYPSLLGVPCRSRSVGSSRSKGYKYGARPGRGYGYARARPIPLMSMMLRRLGTTFRIWSYVHRDQCQSRLVTNPSMRQAVQSTQIRGNPLRVHSPPLATTRLQSPPPPASRPQNLYPVATQTTRQSAPRASSLASTPAP